MRNVFLLLSLFLFSSVQGLASEKPTKGKKTEEKSSVRREDEEET